MGLEKVKYDAFISYRHCPVDKFNAMSIQKQLENFKLPKSLYGKTAGGKTKIKRVFRDQDELPLASNLSDPIEEALENSEFLIVICTPRLPESQWCAKEIETFIRLHGRERVLAVLAEGEPEQSFPESLCFTDKVIVDENGNEHTERVEIEPLAADTRGESRRDVKKQIDDAVLRLAAPIFGLNYDDLKQRHKEQRTKKIITIASAITAVFFVFAMVCMALALRISAQKDTIEEQYNEIEEKNSEILARNEEIEAQNREITEQNEKIISQSRQERIKYAEMMADSSKELLSEGRWLDALYAIRNAMPAKADDTEIPYTTAAERALTDVLGIYDRDSTFTPALTMETSMQPYSMVLSPDAANLMVMDEEGVISVFATDDGVKIAETSVPDFVMDPVWISNDEILFIDDTYLTVFNILTQESIIVSEYSERYVVGTGLSNDVFFSYEHDSETGEAVLCTYSITGHHEKLIETKLLVGVDFQEDYSCQKLVIDEYGVRVAAFSSDKLGFGGEMELSVVDVDTNTLILQEMLGLPILQDVCITYNSVYILANRSLYEEKYYWYSYVYAISLETGDIKWERTYTDTYFTKMTYVDVDNPELIFDEYQNMFILDAESGYTVSNKSHKGELVNAFVFADRTDYTRLMVLLDGSILMYDSETDTLNDYTSMYFKKKNSELIRTVLFSEPSFYICYGNENYIVKYDMLQNGYVCKMTNAEAYLEDDWSGAQISDDGLYALLTEEEYGSEGMFRHIVYDLWDYGTVYTFVDDQRSIRFVRGESERLVEYSGCFKILDFDGNVIISKDYSEYGSFHEFSSDGRCLIYTDSNVNQYVFVSLITGEICLKVPRESLNEKYAVSEAAGLVAVLRDDRKELYHFDSQEPFAVKYNENGYVESAVLSEDGKYLFVSDKNFNLNIYSVPDLGLYKSIYEMNSFVKGVDYSAGLDIYLMNTLNGSYTLNSSLEITRDIYGGFSINSHNDYIMTQNRGIVCSIPYYSYDQLITWADEMLKGYEPSDLIKSKYHI